MEPPQKSSLGYNTSSLRILSRISDEYFQLFITVKNIASKRIITRTLKLFRNRDDVYLQLNYAMIGVV